MYLFSGLKNSLNLFVLKTDLLMKFLIKILLFFGILSCQNLQAQIKLDDILGDKILDINTHKIRNNNFELLKQLKVESLEEASTLYKVESLSENYFLLKQIKTYSEARNFSMVLKTDGKFVIDYYVLNDFFVRDVIQDKKQFILLCDDFGNYNIYWRTSFTAKIINIDKNLHEIWKYEIHYKDYPLKAESSRKTEKSSLHTINVIDGCHMCYSIAELELSNNGKFKSVKEVGTHHVHLSLEALQEIFQIEE